MKILSRPVISMLLLVVPFLFACNGGPNSQTSALARVRSTKTLRCGYAEWPKFLERDVTHGTFTGMFAEVMALVGDSSGLRIEWAEPVAFGDIAEVLSSGRVDAICSGIWPVAARAASMTFTRPISYSPVFAWVRSGDSRLSGLPSLDNKSVRVATIDGEFSQLARGRIAPNAQEYSMPKSSDGAELLLAITSGKADVTFTDTEPVRRFLASHPGSIQRLPGSGPVISSPNSIAVRKGEFELKEMFDIVLDELLASGAIDRVVDKYSDDPSEFLRVAHPWKEVAQGAQ